MNTVEVVNMKAFLLVQLLKIQSVRTTKFVEIVPWTLLLGKNESDNCDRVALPKPPYSPDMCIAIQQHIQAQGSPDPSWINFKVKILDQYDTYEEALDGLNGNNSEVYERLTGDEKSKQIEKVSPRFEIPKPHCVDKIQTFSRKRTLENPQNFYKYEWTSKKLKSAGSESESIVQELSNSSQRSVPTSNCQGRFKEKVDVDSDSEQYSFPIQMDDFEDACTSGYEEINVSPHRNFEESVDEIQASPSQSDSQDSFKEMQRATMEALSKLTVDEKLDRLIMLVSEMHATINEQSRKQDRDYQALKDELERLNSIINPSNSFTPEAASKKVMSAYGYELPIADIEIFHDFEDALERNEKMRTDLMTMIRSEMSSTSISLKAIRMILKALISRNVAIKFTAQKDTQDKKAFSRTRTCGLIYDVMYLNFMKKLPDGTLSPLAKKQFFSEIGLILVQSQDWEGGRKDRVSKKNVLRNEK